MVSMAKPKPDAALVAGLANVPLFAECTKAKLRNIAVRGKVMPKRQGTTIVTEDSTGVAFFSILSRCTQHLLNASLRRSEQRHRLGLRPQALHAASAERFATQERTTPPSRPSASSVARSIC